jgi:hypothetical protein
MPQLTNHSTPAERKRGCVWAVSGGIPNGTAFNLTGTELDSDPISIMVEFTPTFNWDDNADRYLMYADDGAGADRYIIQKRNNAGNNEIRLFLGNTLIADIPSATYSAFWLQNQRNVFVISGTTGDTDAWLNGTQILTNDATAWTPDMSSVNHVGSDRLGLNLFAGTIHSVQIYKAKLTGQEASDFYNQTTYVYNPLAAWQMRMQDHDPVGAQSLDSSGNGENIAFGAGAGAPVKIVRHHGYDLDGAADHFAATVTADVFNNDPFSFVLEFTPHFAFDENADIFLFDTTAGSRYAVRKMDNANLNVLRFYLGNTVIDSVASATYGPYWQPNQRNVITVESVSGDTNIWLNEGLITANDVTAWAPVATALDLYIGCDSAVANFYNGEIHSFWIYHSRITPIRMWDRRINLQHKINDL